MIALKDKPAKATGRSTPEAPTRAEPVQPPDPISAKPIDPVPVDPNAVREVVYGASGIVAITPSSVVVFDRESRKQKEVRVGGVLPDGSTLTGIQANRHRLQTSRGIMALKAPGGDSN